MISRKSENIKLIIKLKSTMVADDEFHTHSIFFGRIMDPSET